MEFASWNGHGIQTTENTIQEWTCTDLARIPAPDQEHLYINIWLSQGLAPANELPVEICIHNAQYTPYSGILPSELNHIRHEASQSEFPEHFEIGEQPDIFPLESEAIQLEDH